MPRLGWLVVVLALLLGGWLTFDGCRALVIGDYVTPRSGAYAGQLGPWAKLVSAVGLDPRSTGVKATHVLLGIAWLVGATAFAIRAPWAWTGLMACAVLSLWYLPFGTLIAVVQIVLLFTPALRR